MGKLGFLFSVIMISVIVTSLIVNIHLFRVINQLSTEIYELQQMEFQTIAKGSNCRYRNTAYYVIENENTWAIIWDQYVSHQEPPPGIDFSKTIIIAVFWGGRPITEPSYEIEIKEVTNDPKFVVVKVEKTYPSLESQLIAGKISPYHIVKMNKVDKEIIFKTVEKTVKGS